MNAKDEAVERASTGAVRSYNRIAGTSTPGEDHKFVVPGGHDGDSHVDDAEEDR